MAERILIIDDDLDTLRLVGLMLQRQGYEISAATNGEQGLAKAIEEKPNLVLLDIMMPGMDGYEVARRLRQNPATANLPILMFTAKSQLDDKVLGFEVGADDYLTKPTHPSELQAHVKALLVRSAGRQQEAVTESRERQAYVIGVLAVRGGMGVSSLAVNLAASLRGRTQSDVLLAELTPGQGTLALDLGFPDQKALTEMLSGNPTAITREKVQDALVTHDTGLRLLLASAHPRDVHLTSQVTQYEMLVSRLASMARYLVLDLGAGLPPFAQKLLTLCHERIVVVEGLLNSIELTKALLKDFADLGLEGKRLTVVLNNRVRSEMQLQKNVAQEKLGHEIAVTLTPAPELFQQAARMKTPVILIQPESLTAQQIAKLADLVLEHEARAK